MSDSDRKWIGQLGRLYSAGPPVARFATSACDGTPFCGRGGAGLSVRVALGVWGEATAAGRDWWVCCPVSSSTSPASGSRAPKRPGPLVQRTDSGRAARPSARGVQDGRISRTARGLLGFG
eukprot:scaffold543_cov312-Prasinococcus_capsulatus_cf.AAC.1